MMVKSLAQRDPVSVKDRIDRSSSKESHSSTVLYDIVSAMNPKLYAEGAYSAFDALNIHLEDRDERCSRLHCTDPVLG